MAVRDVPVYACRGCGARSASIRCERCRPRRRTINAARRLAILDRDGWVCRDPDHDPAQSRHLIDVPHLPNSAHVAHRVAVIDGGSDDDDNVFASCATCNHRDSLR